MVGLDWVGMDWAWLGWLIGSFFGHFLWGIETFILILQPPLFGIAGFWV